MNDATRRVSPIGIATFGAACAFVVFQLALQASPSVMRDGFVLDFSLNDAGFGGFSASFYYPYILLQVLSGGWRGAGFRPRGCSCWVPWERLSSWRRFCSGLPARGLRDA